MTTPLNFPKLCLCLLALTLMPFAAAAQDEAPSPDEAAMMEAFMAAATPGEPHERLAASAGTWNMDVKMWMGPEPTLSTGTAERTMILDGRVLVEEVTASMMGMPFHGYGMTGYDNVTGEYWGTWNDSMSTGISTSRGTFDAESGTYTFHGKTPDPMTGSVKEDRVTLVVTADKEVMEMYETIDGQEVKTMEIVYTRK